MCVFIACVFITAVPITVCVFITVVPITKLFAWGEGDSGRHVLRKTTSRGLRELVCPSRTSERGWEGYRVKEGEGGEGEREKPKGMTIPVIPTAHSVDLSPALRVDIRWCPLVIPQLFQVSEMHSGLFPDFPCWLFLSLSIRLPDPLLVPPCQIGNAYRLPLAVGGPYRPDSLGVLYCRRAYLLIANL